jgi:hypothetical protein
MINTYMTTMIWAMTSFTRTGNRVGQTCGRVIPFGYAGGTYGSPWANGHMSYSTEKRTRLTLGSSLGPNQEKL